MRKKNSKLNLLYMSVNHSRLCNLGNTCYQNAVLHPLIHTPGGFIEFIMSGNYLNHMTNKSQDEIYQTLIFQFHRILNSIFRKDDCEININTWKTLVGKKNCFFAGYEQQDSQEFLSYIIDKISEEIGIEYDFIPTKKIVLPKNFKIKSRILNINADHQWNNFYKKKYSIMIPMFNGMFRTKINYLDSQAENNSFTPFNIIPLFIPKKTTPVNLQDCIKELIRVEKLDNKNLVKSKLSYGQTFATKQETIWKLPKYLIFNLKRFKYNDYGQVTTKDTTIVNYPLELDMKEFIDPDSRYSYLDNKYTLYGVTLHHGIMMGGFSAGHYVAFVKNRTNKKWYIYNDEATPISIKKDKLINTNAYLLFYCRKD